MFNTENMEPHALITGVTGQDGSYLAEFLLEKGYEVYGLIRRASTNNTWRLKNILESEKYSKHFHLIDGDLTDEHSIYHAISVSEPNEIYNLAAQSFVASSFTSPKYTAEVDGIGLLNILEAVRQLGYDKMTRIYQASTSELYGKVEEVPQNEKTPFHPYSPYAIAKQFAFWTGKEYREAYNMFVCNGILFNHESERRGEEFVTRKITLAAANIAAGFQHTLELGNLDSKRDWGYAKDYVECMWLMLQQKEPDDYVIASGEQHTVRDFVNEAFAEVGITLKWEGSGLDEKGINTANNEVVVKVNKDFYRPTDVVDLYGDPSKAKEKLGWTPKTPFKQLVSIMTAYDVRRTRDW